MRSTLSHLWWEEAGQDLAEYAQLLAIIALSSIAAMNSLAQAVGKIFVSAASNLNTST
jgi:Flp pilus assembly pilin Flp